MSVHSQHTPSVHSRSSSDSQTLAKDRSVAATPSVHTHAPRSVATPSVFTQGGAALRS